MTDDVRPRVTDHGQVADRSDCRYALCGYDGVRESLLNSLVPTTLSTLEVGCGTAHWLRIMAGHASILAGVEPSTAMLAQARTAAPGAHLVRARADFRLFATIGWVA